MIALIYDVKTVELFGKRRSRCCYVFIVINGLEASKLKKLLTLYKHEMLGMV